MGRVSLALEINDLISHINTFYGNIVIHKELNSATFNFTDLYSTSCPPYFIWTSHGVWYCSALELGEYWQLQKGGGGTFVLGQIKNKKNWQIRELKNNNLGLNKTFCFGKIKMFCFAIDNF